MSLENVDVLVFDLDGTLYDDDQQFFHLKEELKKQITNDNHEKFDHDYDSIINRTHSLQVGTVYDVMRQWIIHHSNHTVTNVFDWNGAPIPQKKWPKEYEQSFPIKTDTLFPIGDIWELLGVAAFYYKIDTKQFLQSFFATRRYMMSDHFKMTPIQQIDATFAKLYHTKKVVLMTNSSEEDGRAILKKIGIHDYFHHYIFSAKKPIHTQEHLINIQKMYDVPYNRILSIGDNFVNEIIPAKQLNCKTICIDPFQIGNPSFIDLHLENPQELIPALHQML
ncbi:HAD family hydrolase [Massilibacterium senegalense]|uniref:HAD family hydrolase n=1 Tax=Massilibacterium senegalense TaxID=1632858 RepID=UPI0007825CDA|nr:HAD family hydrolase [Massilibacterium senegalense]